MIGRVLNDRYEIIEEIGNGGMAKVYKAKCNRLNRFVAVKVLRQDLVRDAEFTARFDVEGKAAAAISHPNIVGVYDVGSEGEIRYIVMEYIEGTTLKDYITKNKMLSWKEAADFSMQICSALICAHKNGIIHRDIKPQNIMITDGKVLKVTDFGIARAVKTTTATITNSKSTIGSVHYISPEQAKGGYVDEKSDIYSLGVVMYEMVTGLLPFDGENPVTVALKHVQDEPASPKEFNIAVPLAFEKIILKAMRKNQDLRYQTAEELLADLEALKNNEYVPVEDVSAEDGKTKKIPVIKPEDITTEEDKNEKEIIIDEEPPRRDVRRGGNNRRNKKEMNDADKKAIIWAIITSVAVVGILIFAFVSVLFPSNGAETVKVPELEGMVFEDVKDDYTEQGITIILEQTVHSEEFAKGEIISQSPRANVRRKTPLEITVKVSAGTEELILDNYARKEFIDVKLALEKEGIEVTEKREENDEIAEGIVVKTVPGAGEKIKYGDTVIVYVSSGGGEKMIMMPNLLGDDLQTAKQKLTSNELLVGTISGDAENPDAIVVEQSVPANTEVAAYEEIALTVKAQNKKSIAIKIPDDKEQTGVKIIQNGTVIHDAVHSSSEKAFNIDIFGSGATTLEIYYDGKLSTTKTFEL